VLSQLQNHLQFVLKVRESPLFIGPNCFGLPRPPFIWAVTRNATMPHTCIVLVSVTGAQAPQEGPYGVRARNIACAPENT